MISEKIWAVLISTILAIGGGFARLLNLKDDKALRARIVIGQLFVAGFSGIMAYLFVHALALNDVWGYLLAGIGGYGGTRLLDRLDSAVMKKVGLDKSEDKDKKDEPEADNTKVDDHKADDTENNN